MSLTSTETTYISKSGCHGADSSVTTVAALISSAGEHRVVTATPATSAGGDVPEDHVLCKVNLESKVPSDNLL